MAMHAAVPSEELHMNLKNTSLPVVTAKNLTRLFHLTYCWCFNMDLTLMDLRI